MKFEVILTYADYEAGQRAAQPLFARKLPVTMSVLTIVGLGYMKLSGRAIDDYTLLGVGLLWCAVFYMNKVSLPKGWRREFEQSERTSYTVELSEAGVKLVSQFESLTWPWRFFSGWREARECILLRYNKGWSHIIIPKHAFDTDEDLSSMRRLLQKSLGRARGVR
jgi:hypothetical protein